MAILSGIGFAVTASFGTAAIGAVGGGALAGIIGSQAVFAIIGAIVVGVVGFLVTAVLGATGSGDIDSPQDNTTTKTRLATDPNNQLPIPYGETRSAGTFVHGDNSSNQEKLAAICAIGEGPIEEVLSMSWNDSVLYFGSNNQKPSTSSVTKVTTSFGRDGTEDDFLNDNLGIKIYPEGGRNFEMEGFDPDRWGDSNKVNRTMPNSPNAYMEIEFDGEKQVRGFVGKIFFNVKGKKVKTLSTNGTLSSSLTYSNNPAECLLDYMTNSYYGCGIDVNDINLQSFANHKAYCDKMIDYTQKTRRWVNGQQFSMGQRVNYSGKTYTSLKVLNGFQPTGATDSNWTLTSSSETSTVTSSAKRFTCNGTLSTGDTVSKNLDYLTAGNNAILNYNNGIWRVITRKESLKTAGDFTVGRMYVIKTVGTTNYTSIGGLNAEGDVFTATGVGTGTGTADEISGLFSEENMLGELKISGTKYSEIINRLTMKYRSPDNFGQTNQLIIDLRDPNNEFYSATLFKDTGRSVEKTIGIPLTNSSVEAKRMGTQIINEVNQGIQCSYTTHLGYSDVEAGDIIAIRHESPAWGYNADLTAKTAPKLFRVETIKERVREGAIALEMSVVEYASESYTRDSMIIEDDPAPNTNYRKFNTVPVIGTVTVTDASETINGVPVSGLKISYSGSDSFLNRVDFRYLLGTSVPTNPVWITAPSSTTDSLTITGLEPSSVYQIQYRIVSDIGNKTEFVTIQGTTSALSAIAGLTAKGNWPASGAVTVTPGDYYIATNSVSGEPDSLWFNISNTTFTVTPDPITDPPQQPKEQSSSLWSEIAGTPGADGDSYKPFTAWQLKDEGAAAPTTLPSGISVAGTAGTMTFGTANSWLLTEPTRTVGKVLYSIKAIWKNKNNAGTTWTEEVGFSTISIDSGDKGDAFVYSDFTTAELASLKGNTGEDGETGENGTNGINGSTTFNGTANPNITDPTGSVVGDYYIDTDDERYYTKTSDTGTKWTVIITSLGGSTGTNGDVYVERTIYKNAYSIPSDFPTSYALSATAVLTISGNSWTATQTNPGGAVNTYGRNSIWKQTNGTGSFALQGVFLAVNRISGNRGSSVFFRSGSSATTPVVGDAAYNAFALAEIRSDLGDSSALPVLGDKFSLTFTNTGTSVITTLNGVHDGTGVAANDWATFDLELSGSLLVDGTVVSAAINTGGISADKINVDGNINITNASGRITGGLTDTTWDNTDNSTTQDELLSDNPNTGRTSTQIKTGGTGDSGGFWVGNTSDGGRMLVGDADSYLKFAGDDGIITRGINIQAADGSIILASGTTAKAAIESSDGGFGKLATIDGITVANAGTYIADAAIGTALIKDAAITTAKIQNAQVDTLQIAGDAVTVSDAAGPAGGVTLSNNNSGSTKEITSLDLTIPAIAASAGLGSSTLRYSVQFHFNVTSTGNWHGGYGTPSSSRVIARIYHSTNSDLSGSTNDLTETVCAARGGGSSVNLTFVSTSVGTVSVIALVPANQTRYYRVSFQGTNNNTSVSADSNFIGGSSIVIGLKR